MLASGHNLCGTPINRTDALKDLGDFLDLKLYFHQDVDSMFSQAIKFLGLVHTITFPCVSLDSLLILYFALVKSQFKYTSIAWNILAYTDADKLERTQRRYLVLRYNSLFSKINCSFGNALDYLNLHTLFRILRGGGYMRSSLLMSTMASYFILPYLQLLAFVFLLLI